jgi:hypothetical protein
MCDGVFAAMLLDIQIFWIVTPCRWENSHRFVGTTILKNTGNYLPVDIVQHPKYCKFSMVLKRYLPFFT